MSSIIGKIIRRPRERWVVTGHRTSDEADPLVSVVVVTYNSERTVGETLSSLAEQTYPDDRYELLVVDGGSSDDTEWSGGSSGGEYTLGDVVKRKD